MLFGEEGEASSVCGVSSLSAGRQRLALGVSRGSEAGKERTSATFLFRDGVSGAVGDMHAGVRGSEGKEETWGHFFGCESACIFLRMGEAGVVLGFLGFPSRL